jgi:hypothetical protein
MTQLKCAARCDGAYNVFEESVLRSGSHVPRASRVARREMEYWLNEAEEWTQASTIAPSSPALHAGEPDTEKIDTLPS